MCLLRNLVVEIVFQAIEPYQSANTSKLCPSDLSQFEFVRQTPPLKCSMSARSHAGNFHNHLSPDISSQLCRRVIVSAHFAACEGNKKKHDNFHKARQNPRQIYRLTSYSCGRKTEPLSHHCHARGASETHPIGCGSLSGAVQ